MNAFLFGLTIAVAAPAIKDPPKAEPSILGDWKLTEWLLDGSAAGVGSNDGVAFLPGGKRLWRTGPGDPEERGYKLYPRTNPARVDMIRADAGDGQTVHPCIFKVEGDTLVIAVGRPGGERPKSFEGAAYMKMTYTRIKKKD